MRHDAVVVVAAPVLEHDVRVVVDDELVEARLGAPDATLGRSTGAQRVLRDVRHVLLEDERRLLASCPALTGAAARTTREHLAQSAPRDHRRHQQPRSHHSLSQLHAVNSRTSKPAIIGDRRQADRVTARANGCK